MQLPILTLCLALFAIGLPAVALPAETLDQPLIQDKVDERQIVPLAGNTRPEATRAVQHTRVTDSMQLDHIQMLLRRSPQMEKAVEGYLRQASQKGSPLFHRWLTAKQFGERFGPAPTDIQRITTWLKANGFAVNGISQSRMMLDFSGNAGQIRSAFHTEIHRFPIGNAAHFANMNDPQIPAALAPAIAGIVSLHDFRPRSTRRPRPQVTSSCFRPCTAVGPGDLATIYNLKPLFDAGYRGQGQVIAAVEATNLYSKSDWTNFRKTFGLTRYPSGQLVTIHPNPAGSTACVNPGVQAGDDGEAALDVEWATAAAPAAKILLASCANAGSTSGVFLALQNLINSDQPPQAISVSYAVCEVENGAAANAAFDATYQQAAAEGISVYVASGDSGASGCAPGPDATWSGIGINGWGDSQYVVSVGGTDFRDTFDQTNNNYWSADAGAPWSTALSYVPEIPWNDNCASLMIAKFYGETNVTYGVSGFCNSDAGSSFHTLSAGGGGPSHCFSGNPQIGGVVSGSCRGYPKPWWQQGFIGIPNDGVRDTPDIALFASDAGAWGHAYATCYSDPNGGGGPCTGNPIYWAGNSGGTSYGAPIMAGIQALVNQYKGGPQGNAAPVLYSLATQENGASGNINCSANKGSNIDGSCVFHDIVTGENDVYCVGPYNCYQPSGGYGILSRSKTSYYRAFPATRGYDMATGIGSINAYNLVVNWP